MGALTASSAASDPPRFSGRGISLGIAIVAGVLLYVLARNTDGREVWHAASRIPIPLLLAMCAIQAYYVSQQGSVYRELYAAAGYPRSQAFCCCLYLTMSLVNVLAPSGGLSAPVYMVQFEAARGVPRGAGSVITFLYHLIDYVIFLVVLAASLAYLSAVASVGVAVAVTSAVFMCFVAAFLGIGVFLLLHRRTLERFLGLLKRFGGTRLRQADFAGLYAFLDHGQAAWRQSWAEPSRVARAAFHTLMFHVLSIAILYLAFVSVGVHAPIHTMVTGYAVGTLLTIVSFTPSGMGIAEGGMTAALAALSIPVAQALVIVLVYRAITNWIPLLFGVAAMHALPSLAGPPREVSASIEPS